MGAIAMASAVVALFFVRFWRETGDRLFAIFALAFLLLGITRFGLAMSREAVAQEGRPPSPATDAVPAATNVGDDQPSEAARGDQKLPIEEVQTHWYWVRLTAFLLILVAIIDKNRR